MIDLSHLNEFVLQSSFKLESNQLVPRSLQMSNWMVSIDLKDVYLQVLIHPDSRKFLRFMVDGTVYQFQALCFGLSTAPQVFTRVMAPAPVSVMLYSLGVRMLRYLDDWLILASSRSEALQGRDEVLNLCQSLGIVVNLEKSCLVPSQTVTYLGMVLVSPSLKAFPTPMRVTTLLTQIAEFLLQEAKCCLLAMSSRSAVLPMSPCSRRSSANEVPASRVERPVGFH